MPERIADEKQIEQQWMILNKEVIPNVYQDGKDLLDR